MIGSITFTSLNIPPVEPDREQFITEMEEHNDVILKIRNISFCHSLESSVPSKMLSTVVKMEGCNAYGKIFVIAFFGPLSMFARDHIQASRKFFSIFI